MQRAVGRSCTACKTRRSETYLGNLMKYCKCLEQPVEISAASLSYSETEVTGTGTRGPAWL